MKDKLRELKWFIQRGIRGYADCDCWDIDCYLAKIIPPMIKDLKENGYGLPTLTEDKTEKEALDEWNKILDDIIFAWEAQQKIQNIEWMYGTYNVRKKLKRAFKHHKDIHIMTTEECERYRMGMKLFIKHLNSLWN